MASNGSTNKRRRTSPEGLHITDLPDGFLADVGTYLSKPSRALFAAAMTAPSASWCKFNWTHQPSATSRTIISFSPADRSKKMGGKQRSEKQWGVLDFVEIEKSLARELTDDDIGSILACIDARQTLKKLKLTGCVNIIGHGLESLRGSISLEQIDLSLVKQHERPDIQPEPLITEVAVFPILDSIIDADGCSLKCIVFPAKWRRGRMHDMRSFLGRYEQVFVNRRLSCSSCDTSMEGQPWITGTYQNNVCYSCLKQFCNGDGCDVQFCRMCKKDFCSDCVPMPACAVCGNRACNGCRCKKSCENCGEVNCEDCLPTRNCCGKPLCIECAPVLRCEDCSKQHCEDCFDGKDYDVKFCEDCQRDCCLECVINECEKDWEEACSGCKKSCAEKKKG